MSLRCSWKGYLRLNLVSVPVKGYATAESRPSEIRLNQLHRNCHGRIRHQKRCEQHGPIEADEIVSGYEFAPGEYVVLEPEELQSLRPERDKSIAIESFVQPNAVDAVYFNGKGFYLLPDGPVAERAYALLRQTLESKQVHGVARMVLSGRDQLLLVRPCRRLLALSGLQYGDRVKAPSTFEDELSSPEVGDEETRLMSRLIEALRGDDFDITNETDPYTERLAAWIDAKINGRQTVTASEPDEPEESPLLEALEASVQQAQPETDAPTSESSSLRGAPEREQSAVDDASTVRHRRSG